MLLCITLIWVTAAKAQVLSCSPLPLQELLALGCQLCFLLLSLGTVQLPLLLHHLGPVLCQPHHSLVLGLGCCRPPALLAGLPLCLLLLARFLSQLLEPGCVCITAAWTQYVSAFSRYSNETVVKSKVGMRMCGHHRTTSEEPPAWTKESSTEELAHCVGSKSSWLLLILH